MSARPSASAGSRSTGSRSALGAASGTALELAGALLPPPVKLAVVCAGLGAVALLTLLMSLAALTATGAVPAGAETQSSGASAAAQQEIPPEYLRYYQQAAERYGLDWAILAGIGKVECDHGRDPDPSCTHEGAINSAGAGGPMQFIASTWARYGVDGDGDSRVDRWDAADAIYGAANYLRAAGAPGDYRQAIFAYNHATWYVEEVEHWAAVYRESGSGGAGAGPGEGAPGGSQGSAGGSAGGEGGSWSGDTSTSVEYVPGEQAALSATNGHLALIPAAAPAAVQAMVIAGNELQELPYGPTGHPDPRGATSEDCSSTINYVLYRSGVRPIAEIVRENPLAQDYVDWGAPGPGRWVTIYATTAPTDHVFIVIAGLRLDTSHNGTDIGPNRDQDGPRWRLLDHIPAWAHWSVRHPPGL
jgi:uncharacterized membrane protein YgcG